MMMISQELFDETLLESQELFEYSDVDAVKETIAELQSSTSTTYSGGQIRLDHLSLTHPESPQGKKDRELQRRFVTCLEDHDVEHATVLLKETVQENEDVDARTKKANRILSLWSLFLQKNLWETVVGSNVAQNTNGHVMVESLVSFVVALFPDLSSISFHPMSRDLKLVVAPTWFFVEDGSNDEKGDIVAATESFHWFRLLDSAQSDADNRRILRLVRLARKLCNGCEDNKKAFVQAGIRYHRCADNIHKTGLELLVDRLPSNVSTSFAGLTDDEQQHQRQQHFEIIEMAKEVCQLIAILGKFQPLAEPSASAGKENQTEQSQDPGQPPLVSSAHANVKEFHKAGAVPSLHRVAKQCMSTHRQNGEEIEAEMDDEAAETGLLCDSLAALRVMAIDNDIVQNMIALGILDTVHNALEVAVAGSSCAPFCSMPLATATLGLVRNLCANDEVKTSICKSSLPSILHIMQNYLLVYQKEVPNEEDSKKMKGCAALQEHACGILAAMSLRQPQNAQAIIDNSDDANNCGGHSLILQAMKTFPDKVTLQRQGCLALRNIASRLSASDKARILDAGAEDVLQNIAGQHPASSEEAYAALRDLGCNPVMYDVDEYGNPTTKSTTQLFGTVQSNFRPVYE